VPIESREKQDKQDKQDNGTSSLRCGDPYSSVIDIADIDA